VNLLLDTHVFLWWCQDHPRLRGSRAGGSIADPANVVHVSAASAWEIAIKESISRLSTPEPVESAVARSGFLPLPIDFRHARAAGRLPPHHRDPFDRMLVAQALVENLVFVTHDTRLARYGAELLRV